MGNCATGMKKIKIKIILPKEEEKEESIQRIFKSNFPISQHSESTSYIGKSECSSEILEIKKSVAVNGSKLTINKKFDKSPNVNF